ncbi:MAG: O-methyltransferase [Geminicoccaceae bacterium]
MTLTEPAVTETLHAEAAKHGFEESCAATTGALLRTLAAAKPKGRILNLGTGFGISCAWLLDGMSHDAELWTVDIDETGSAAAKAHLDRRLHVVVEDAATFLEGAGALGQRFDLIFADAMPGKYEHRDLALDLVAPGGLYVVDDLSPTTGWKEGAPLAKALIDEIEADPRFVSLNFDWSTGHLLAVRLP